MRKQRHRDVNCLALWPFMATHQIRSRVRKKGKKKKKKTNEQKSLIPLISSTSSNRIISTRQKIWNMDSVYPYYHSLMKETPHYIWEHSHITFWCSAICRLEKLWFLCQNQQQEGSSYSDILPRKHCRIVFEQQLSSKLFDTFISAFFLSNKITNHSVSLGGGGGEECIFFLSFTFFQTFWQLTSI